ncbi:MAG: DHHA1 domain-containing protein, partial [Alphaproteobacteria bacterium]|nr:DHHA1 domain-containing protein [Alphaproteobacteria bacterium]
TDTGDILKVAPADLPQRVEAIIDERRQLDRDLKDARKRLATGGAEAGQEFKDVAGVKLAARKLDGIPAKELRSVADGLKKQIGSGIVALVAVDEGKASLVVGVTDDLTEKYSAVDLVRAGVEALGGKGGGGRPDMAQGGGPNGGAADAALSAVENAMTR